MKKMSRWGIGPVFALISIIYGAVMLAATRYFKPAWQIPFLPKEFLSASGIALIVIGVPFFIVSVRAVSKAYNRGALVTGGIYRFCRHPLYSAWVFFIVPGIVFLVNSLPGLTTPFFMYYLLRKLAIKEEIYLENTFGSEYNEYKKQVPFVLPVGWLITKRGKQ